MAGCAIRTSFAGHPSRGAKARHALTFEMHHPTGPANTTWRAPLSITALSETVSTGACAPVAISTSPYISGRNRPSGFCNSSGAHDA
jgi:hypothetical protein